MDDAAGRVDGGVHHRVVLSVHLILVFDDLDAEKLGYEDEGRYAEADDEFVLPVQFHLSVSYFLSSGVRMWVTRSDSSQLHARDSPK